MVTFCSHHPGISGIAAFWARSVLRNPGICSGGGQSLDVEPPVSVGGLGKTFGRPRAFPLPAFYWQNVCLEVKASLALAEKAVAAFWAKADLGAVQVRAGSRADPGLVVGAMLLR